MSVSTTTTTTGRVLVKEYLKIARICFVGGLVGCAYRNYKDTNQLSITYDDVGFSGLIALSWHLTLPILVGVEIYDRFSGGGVHKFEFEFTTEKKD